jgi:hypothetical protein
MAHPSRSLGQVLILFVLFLLVLLGISALAIDYATWLVTDRTLQNVADHASLAGASAFEDRTTATNCSGNKCIDARRQAWTSLNDELDLGLTTGEVGALAASDTAAGGITVAGSPDRFWVTTPPPSYAAYVGAGGRYINNHGVVFVRVDRQVRSFLGGPLGIQPGPRTGWATAGALPQDFALEVFCRNHIPPQSGVCENSAGLTIDGQGGIRLRKGDIGSNESLTVTANVGQGVIMEDGNVFLVNRSCAPSTWNCPNGPPSRGGISDGAPSYNGKSAFYMPPLPVPRYASPVDAGPNASYDCSGASSTLGDWCIPHKDQGNPSPSNPGDWTCVTSGAGVLCGVPTVDSSTSPSTVSCAGQGAGSPQLHYYPTAVSAGASTIQGDALHPQSNGNEYRNIDDSFEAGDPDASAPPADPPTDWVYTNDINLTGAGAPQTSSFTVNLGPSGSRLAGSSTVRYVAFKTHGGVPNDTQNAVTLQVRLLPGSGTTAIAVDPAVRTLADQPTLYEFTVGAGVIPASEFNSLRLEFVFTSSGSTAAADERGGGVSWAEIEHPGPQPATPPMIPPGYYHSIEIPSGGCAILDPTGEYSTLEAWQMPGIYRFGGPDPGGSNRKRIELEPGAFLIGDGVTFVFDDDWPASGSHQGLDLSPGSALVLNTMRVPGVPPCTPSQTETSTINQSAPLSLLPYSSLCAAWAIDHRVTTGIRPGASAWPVCDAADAALPHCAIDRASDYNPTPIYRGITFYFTPDGNWATPHASIAIRKRFEMPNSNDAGLSFRGVLYAPYDDVKITGGAGFNAVGQVLAWTAKFHGGSAFIDLDYPYDYSGAPPYLLEPTIQH